MIQGGPLDPEIAELMGMVTGLDQQPREENIATDFQSFSRMVDVWTDGIVEVANTLDALPAGYSDVELLNPRPYNNYCVLLLELQVRGCPIVFVKGGTDTYREADDNLLTVAASDEIADDLRRDIEILLDVLSGNSVSSDRASAHIGDYNEYPFEPLPDWRQTGRVFRTECPAIVRGEPGKCLPEMFMTGVLLKGYLDRLELEELPPGDVELYNHFAAMRGDDGERIHVPLTLEQFQAFLRSDLAEVFNANLDLYRQFHITRRFEELPQQEQLEEE